MTTAEKKYTQREKIILSEVSGWDEDSQELFWFLIQSKGQSISFAHIAVSRQSPGLQTDTSMMSGQQRIKNIPDGRREKICEAIIKNGGVPNMNDVYMPGLANRKGDPEAQIDSSSPRAQIKKLCEKRRYSTESGPVKVDAYSAPGKDPREHAPRLHQRILNRHKQKLFQENPGLKQKDQREIDQMLTEKHTRKRK